LLVGERRWCIGSAWRVGISTCSLLTGQAKEFKQGKTGSDNRSDGTKKGSFERRIRTIQEKEGAGHFLQIGKRGPGG